MSTSASSAALVAHSVAVPVSEKLTRANHALWKAQVRAAMRGARLEGHLTGATKMPDEEIVDNAG